ncbi:MAG: hypothetical protein JWO80_6149 [Bryobacterales bacterium]|nr:hypothetical protein [Bryobacterales bacterium]
MGRFASDLSQSTAPPARYNRLGSYSWPVLGTDFKPDVRHSVSLVGSTPTSFRQKTSI